MSRRWWVNLAKYGGSALFIGLAAWLYLGAYDFPDASLVEKYRLLCDAFTIPGVILLMLGCLIWASGQGALDGVTYALRYAIYSLIPGKLLERSEKYGDYIQRKRENRLKGYGFLFITGGASMAVSLVFMALFYSLYS